MAETRYPYGYGTGTKTMAELRERYEPKSHPEFARRLFAWLESMGGQIGIGSGWRVTPSNVSAASRAGRSFHQDQRFDSGFVGYSAVDLVALSDSGVHRAPTWDESETAPDYGLHTFINNEPWHIQCIEMRGWQTWVSAGRPDPDGAFVLPIAPDPELPDPDPEEDMPAEDIPAIEFRFRHVDYADQFSCGASGAMHMTPGILEHYDHLPLVENDDREWLIHCCNDAGFDFARLTPI